MERQSTEELTASGQSGRNRRGSWLPRSVNGKRTGQSSACALLCAMGAAPAWRAQVLRVWQALPPTSPVSNVSWQALGETPFARELPARQAGRSNGFVGSKTAGQYGQGSEAGSVGQRGRGRGRERCTPPRCPGPRLRLTSVIPKYAMPV